MYKLTRNYQQYIFFNLSTTIFSILQIGTGQILFDVISVAYKINHFSGIQATTTSRSILRNIPLRMAK